MEAEWRLFPIIKERRKSKALHPGAPWALCGIRVGIDSSATCPTIMNYFVILPYGACQHLHGVVNLPRWCWWITVHRRDLLEGFMEKRRGHEPSEGPHHSIQPSWGAGFRDLGEIWCRFQGLVWTSCPSPCTSVNPCPWSRHMWVPSEKGRWCYWYTVSWRLLWRFHVFNNNTRSPVHLFIHVKDRITLKLKIELPYDPAIPLLSLYPEKVNEWVKVTQSCHLTLCDPVDHTVHRILQARILEWVAFAFSRGSSQLRDQTIIQKDTCTLMFIAALFTIAKTWKQPKCPSAGEWVKKMWCIYYNGLLLSHQRNKTGSLVEICWSSSLFLIQSS